MVSAGCKRSPTRPGTGKPEYDALDRQTKVDYPDGSSEEIHYNRLDPTEFIDRQGHENRGNL